MPVNSYLANSSLVARQLDMRMRQLHLTPDERFAIGRGWSKTCLALLALQVAQMKRDLSADELHEMRRLERLTELRFRVWLIESAQRN